MTKDVHVLRDPTRGGVGSTLMESASAAQVGVRLDETSNPIAEDVKAACELLGLDPRYVATEGKLVVIVSREHAEVLLGAVRRPPLAAGAAIIDEVVADHPGMVVMKTRVRSERVADMLPGEQPPRIC